MNFVYFLNISKKRQHFNLTNGKLVYCFHGGISFFGTKLTSRLFPNLLFSAVHNSRNFGAKRDFIHKHSLHKGHTYHSKQLNEYISKRAFSWQGETCFLEMQKKCNACPSLNKSTERRPRAPPVPHHQSAILSTIAAFIT